MCALAHAYSDPCCHLPTILAAAVHAVANLYPQDLHHTLTSPSLCRLDSPQTCRNLEWQVCAARGYLPGQMSRDIRFAFRPAELQIEFIGACTGYHPAGCGDKGYASYDIFFLEACMYSTMCTNGWELFQLQVGQTFHCELSLEGFNKLRDWTLGAK
jgi:hypothetical protein